MGGIKMAGGTKEYNKTILQTSLVMDEIRRGDIFYIARGGGCNRK